MSQTENVTLNIYLRALNAKIKKNTYMILQLYFGKINLTAEDILKKRLINKGSVKCALHLPKYNMYALVADWIEKGRERGITVIAEDFSQSGLHNGDAIARNQK